VRVQHLSGSGWRGTHEPVSPHPTWINDIDNPRSIQLSRTFPWHVLARACLPDDGLICIPLQLSLSARRSTYARRCEMRLSSCEPLRLATRIQACHSASTDCSSTSLYAPPFAPCRHGTEGCLAPRYDHHQIPLLVAPRYDHSTFLCFHRSFGRRPIEKGPSMTGSSVVPCGRQRLQVRCTSAMLSAYMSQHRRTHITLHLL
jgi:hypothetical protein